MNDRTKLLLKTEGVLISIFLVFIALWFLCSCSTQERVVNIPEIHEVFHNHTDSVIRRDSVIDRQKTVIRELDSAAMAAYGIQLQRAERAWLVQTDQMRRELSELREAKSDTVIQRDSVPYPVKVPVEVPAELSWWQQTRMILGTVVLGLLFAFVVYKIGKWHIKRLRP